MEGGILEKRESGRKHNTAGGKYEETVTMVAADDNGAGGRNNGLFGAERNRICSSGK